jgi:hypothetical protein
MANDQLKAVALQILDWLNFDTSLDAVQQDADEIVQIMLDNEMGEK